jgi:hypothetical protein
MSVVMFTGLLSLPIAAVAVFLLARGRHIAIAFIIGLLGFVPGYMIGVDHFCASDSAGNLCGLGAAFGTAPLGFAIGSIGYAALSRFFAKDTKRAAARRAS